MLLKEIINNLLEKDSYELFLWIQFLSKKISCIDCIETRKKLSGKAPKCNECVPASTLIKKHFGKGVDSNEKDRYQ